MKQLIDVASGRVKADIVIKNANVVDVFNGVFVRGDVAVCGDKIAGRRSVFWCYGNRRNG